MLRSTLFFSDRNLRARVSDPVGFVIGSVRALEHFDPPPSTWLLAEWTDRLEQRLFFPPNVGGWPGGRSWLSGRAVVARANFAAALTSGQLNSDASPPDLLALAGRRGQSGNPATSLRFFSRLLLGHPLGDGLLEGLLHAAGTAAACRSPQANRALALLLARPEAQLV